MRKPRIVNESQANSLTSLEDQKKQNVIDLEKTRQFAATALNFPIKKPVGMKEAQRKMNAKH